MEKHVWAIRGVDISVAEVRPSISCSLTGKIFFHLPKKAGLFVGKHKLYAIMESVQ